MRKFVISALVVLSLCGGIGVLSAPVWAESDKELNDEVKTLSSQIGKDKCNWRLFGERGRILILLKKYDEAADDLRIALSLNRRWADGDGLMASALICKKDFKEAMIYIDRALSLKNHPRPDAMLALKSLCLHELGRDRESVQAAKESLKINPNNYDACYWGAAALNNLKTDKPEVLRLLHRCAEINPADTKVPTLIKALEGEQ